jgi:hypothetical protein
MDPTAIVNLALLALQGVLALVNEIKGQSGLTDDQILAQAQVVTAGNDTAYQTLVAALQGSVIAPKTS